jgi:hypothetical protein
MDKLPFRDFALNEVCLEISLIAEDLAVWTKHLGSTAFSTPKNPCPAGRNRTPAPRARSANERSGLA